MDKNKASDAARSGQLVRAFRRNGFTCMDSPLEYSTYESRGIRAVCPDFVYPNDVLSAAKALLEQCPTWRKTRTACETDCGALNRSPILRTDYMNYQILRLQR